MTIEDRIEKLVYRKIALLNRGKKATVEEYRELIREADELECKAISKQLMDYKHRYFWEEK